MKLETRLNAIAIGVMLGLLLVGQNWKKHPHSHLTEAEIKEDFEWAWQFAKEVENKCK